MFSDDLVFGRVMMPLVSPKITGWSAHSNFDYSCIWVLVESWAFLAQCVLLVQCWMFHRNKQFKSFPPCRLLFNITFIVKYLVTWLITLLAPSLLSKSGACVLACKDESTSFCRLTSLTQFNCFSRPVSEMAVRFCCLFEIAGRFHCFFCLLYW